MVGLGEGLNPQCSEVNFSTPSPYYALVIRVEAISKKYGSLCALREVSFEVEKGEMVGFVGPNGAGKTTMLRILCGYLLADEGQVSIAGYDLRTARADACGTLGYMPENAPLHEDMRVLEFLRYRARLKGVSRAAVSTRVSAVIEQLELGEVQRRLISRLSRGFRQRVALADALVADPSVLLLDEPTSGLDPLQRRSFRKLLKELSAQRSVLLSSHVLPEIEALTPRLLVIAKGAIVADGDAASLRRRAGLPEGADTEDVFAALVGGEHN